MTITTTTADAARQDTIETLQRAWLAEAAKGKAKDIMAHARRTGEKLHDQNLKRLEANLKLLSRPPSQDHNDELRALRNTYHKDAQHHSEDDPVYAALKPFLTTNGAARQRLEDIAREYLSLEQDYLDMAERHPDRAQHFLTLAATEREKADAQLTVSKTDPETNLQPKPKPPRGLSNQRLPVKTLEKVIDIFTKRTKRTIRLQYQDEPEEEDTAADDEDSPPPPPACGTNKFSYYTPPEPHDPGEPDLRLDETTLRNICQQETGSNEIPPHMNVLLIGPVGDQAIVDTIAAIDRECAEEHRQRSAQNTCMRAWKAHKTIYTTANHRFPPEAPDNLLDADTLAQAWQDAGWEGNMPDYMNNLLAGPKGRDARQEAFAQARTELLQAEEHHEKTVWQMTDRQRIEKRLDPDYRHSPLDLTREQLAAIWRNDGDDGPMPRAWLTQSHELPWRPLLVGHQYWIEG